jgi:ubiquinone/menaquinone biosynthesis C-methylase UbiE
MHLFERDWQTYSKVVRHNYMHHREVYAQLRQLLTAEAPRPYSFLDLACGDASASIEALKSTAIASYHGVDLSRPALALAKKALLALGCSATLEHGDFAQALADRTQPVDVIWIGQSLHHFDRAKKLAVMRDARRLCGEHGLFLIWEPTHLEGEDQEVWLQRFQATCRPLWGLLKPEEWDAMVEHIRSFDHAETSATWQALGNAAGFDRVDEVFTTPLSFNRIYYCR